MTRVVDAQTLLMHQVMLGDGVRLKAYDEALRRAVAPGDIVIDVGAGTLVLSLLALQHGAGHVYAIEGDPAAAVIARAVAERNDLGGRLTLIQGDARTVDLPVKADVIVSEMMGNLGPEEEMAEVLAAVAARNLKRSGRVVPRRLVTHLQAIEFAFEGWGVWTDDFWGYSFSPVQDYAPAAAQLHFFAREPIRLSEPAIVADETLGTPPRGLGDAVRLEIVAPGTMHAVVGSFIATLADGVTLSNLPSYPGCNWAVWVWPVRHTKVCPGVVVEARLRPPPAVRVARNWRLDCSLVHPEAASAA
jgi:Ribosomal protein L11 methyltransferase (PrmA)